MGYVAQDGGLIEFLTVRQTLDLFHGLHSLRDRGRDTDFSGLGSINIRKCFRDFQSRFKDILGFSRAVSRGSRSDRIDADDGGIDISSGSYRGDISSDLDSSNDHALECDTNIADTRGDVRNIPDASDAWSHLIGSAPHCILPSKYLNYFVHNLSGGNRKKLSVAISNINNPSLLSIDECTSGRDASLVLSHHVMSCHVILYHVVSNHVISCRVISCRVALFPLMPCKVVRCPVMSLDV